jgi:hypothetical protein
MCFQQTSGPSILSLNLPISHTVWVEIIFALEEIFSLDYHHLWKWARLNLCILQNSFHFIFEVLLTSTVWFNILLEGSYQTNSFPTSVMFYKIWYLWNM